MRMVQEKKDKPAYMLRRYFVRWGSDVIEVHCDPDEPSIELKKLLEEKTGIPVDEQRIFYAGMKKAFECDKNLRYYGAQGGGFFDLARDEDLDDDFNIINKKPKRRTSLPSGSDHDGQKPRSSSVVNDEEMKKQMKKVAEEEARRAAAEKTQARLEAYRAKKAAEKAAKEEEAAAKAARLEEERKQLEEEARVKAELEAARKEEEEEQRRLAEEAKRAAAEAKAAELAAEKEKLRAEAEAAQAEAARKLAEVQAANRAAEVIQVQVRTPDGQMIPLEMKRSDTIGMIQEKLESEAGIEESQQILKFDGKDLVSHETADDVGLDNGSVIDLECKPIQVQVGTPDGKTIPMEINPYENIQAMQEQLATETGIDVDRQVLKFDGTELPNDKIAKAVGLKNGSIIDLEHKPINIQVRTPDGKTILIEIKPTDSVQSVKEKLVQETGMDVDKQVLSCDGQELPNNRTADDLGIKDGSVLDLEESPMQLQVNTPDGQTVSVQMKPSDTIQTVKEKLAAETGIEVDQQILKCNGNELPNDSSASDLGLQDGSVLDLEEKTFQVHVQTPDGDTVPVEMKASDTVYSVKERLAAETGMSPSQQILTCDGKELPNDATGGDFGLQDGSVLDLEAKSMEVQVITPEGNAVPVQVKPSDSIQSIKEKLAAETGIELPKQILKFNEEELEDSQTACDAGLQEGSVLDLRVKEEPKPEKKEKKEKKKKKKDKRESAQFVVHESKDYSHEYTPTPFDLSRFKIWFMVGDQIPFEMVCPAGMDVKTMKVEILKLKNEARFVKQYFDGIEDPNVIKVYPAGSWGEGEPLADDLPVPRDSSEYNFFSVHK